FRPVRNLATLDDALSSRLRAPRAHDFGMRSRLCSMRLNIPIRSGEGLPDAIQIRFAVGRAGRCIRRKPARGCLTEPGGGDRDHYEQYACHSNMHEIPRMSMSGL